MKKKLIIIYLISFLVIFSGLVLADQIELQDGNVIRGEIKNEILNMKTDYADLKLQTKYISKIVNNNEFVVSASENNKFRGQLLTEINFKNGGGNKYSPSEIKTISISNNDSFNGNNGISLKLKNGDSFSANNVEENLKIDTSLGSSLSISYNNISAIEYLKNEDIYLIKRKNDSKVKSDLKQKKIILWPAIGEIIEVDFKFIEKIEFDS